MTPTGVYVRTPEYRAKMSAAKQGVRMSAETVAKIAGARNPGWKGDAVSYQGLHQWLYRARGPARDHGCAEVADGTCNGRMEWSNISGRYLRDLSDYEPLCRSHHARRDGTGHRHQTHCPRGHPYDAANTIAVPGANGRTWRRCRTCKAAGDRAYKARKRTP